jgi:hypothetical protein
LANRRPAKTVLADATFFVLALGASGYIRYLERLDVSGWLSGLAVALVALALREALTRAGVPVARTRWFFAVPFLGGTLLLLMVKPLAGSAYFLGCAVSFGAFHLFKGLLNSGV